MIYIVTGDGPRCGSSAMMRGLQAGGLPLAYDKLSVIKGEENYELSEETMAEDNFPPARFDGHAVKLFPWPWSPLGAEIFPGDKNEMMAREYSVVWLSRPADERWKSFARVNPTIGLSFQPYPAPSKLWRDACANYVFEYASYAFPMVVIRMDQLRDNPLEVFEVLRQAEWPIDPKAAARALMEEECTSQTA